MSRRRRPRRRQEAAPPPDRAPDGQVIARKGPVMTIELPGGETVDCIGHGPGKGAVVGDLVHLDFDAEDERAVSAMCAGVVRHVSERRTELIRSDALGRRAQVLAANVDMLFIVVAPEPPLREGLIDRYLVAADRAGLVARVVFNKIDLLDDAGLLDALERLQIYPKLGYPLHLTSADSRQGVDALAEALVGQTSIFVGHSGVGKTSLLNALDPGLGERVQDLSGASGRGQHTTSASALYHLPRGGDLIDSPGVRGFGLWDIAPEEVKDHFVELATRADQCRFADCQHISEPGCAVLSALKKREISEKRYDSYLRIRDSIDDDFGWRDGG